ncbi:Fc.00g036720.m01.CDS01 [Cosmosporella sp. VM-42]
MAAVSGSGMLVAHLQQHQQQLDSAAAQDKSAIAPPLRTTSTSSFSSSPRLFELTDSILEEGGESGSESFVEPVTPVSGRHSQDNFTLQSQDLAEIQTLQSYQTGLNSTASAPNKTSFPLDAALSSRRPSTTTTPSTPKASDEDAASTGAPLSRRPTRGSTSSFKRTMSSIFRRTTSQVAPKGSAIADSAPAPSVTSGTSQPTSNGQSRASQSRRFSMNRSSTTTRSNSPPSPSSPLEMHVTREPTASGTVPDQNDFKKKNRASTGLTLRGRAVNFVGATVGRGGARPRINRRASSFDGSRPHTPAPKNEADDDSTYPPERLPWPLPPDAGTGAKARRMSLSLPDDFTVDVAELPSEFEYQHKFLGRHGKHLGKGAASKVTLMMRKGYPEELYAVKEFRGKSHRESQSDYEKKIKSEFSIAKSLHHPNIVETIRLCTDHARWNHVMEYCSEGDLFSLVQKGHLKGDERKKDRLCLFKQLIQGVGYLHANGIAHRDIKLENLLITKDSKLKITDFGVSEVFSGTHPGLRESGGQCGQNMGEIRLCSPGICGSEPYIAPEVLEKKNSYDARALDVWSSAIVMIYLTFGGAIWNRAERAPSNTHYNKLADAWEKWYAKHPECDACISDTDYPKCFALDVGVNPPALRRLLLQMLNPDPNKRISIDGVLNNRWMKGVECCQLESYDDPALLIDATKKDTTSSKRIFCHNHLPPKVTGHSLGKMPGQAGY